MSNISPEQKKILDDFFNKGGHLKQINLNPKDHVFIAGNSKKITDEKIRDIEFVTGIKVYTALDKYGNRLSGTKEQDLFAENLIGADILELQKTKSFLLLECDFREVQEFDVNKHFFVMKIDFEEGPIQARMNLAYYPLPVFRIITGDVKNPDKG